MIKNLPAVCILAVFACLGAGAAAAAPSMQAQREYCNAEGGKVQIRVPAYNTNGGTPEILSGAAAFCQFTSSSDGSSISVLLDTLTTTQPTLAALAYYAETPFNGATCEGSPGSCYCSQVGGTDLFGGINAAGGGWLRKSDPSDADVLDACIFPDLSSIDSYGLFYHSAGIVRGKDLAGVLRFANPY